MSKGPPFGKGFNDEGYMDEDGNPFGKVGEDGLTYPRDRHEEDYAKDSNDSKKDEQDNRNNPSSPEYLDKDHD